MPEALEIYADERPIQLILEEVDIKASLLLRGYTVCGSAPDG